MRYRAGILVLAVAAALSLATTARAHQSTGAIFTTVADGSEVNFNNYPSKDAVYLDGGPGPGAPQTAAGLTDGIYVFQVTDPSGKKLLSQDIAACRRFTVSGGIITGLYNPDNLCTAPHLTGTDVDHGATTIQLMPYADTPNHGGVYKAWATFLSDYTGTFGCSLTSIDCSAAGTFHGFGPSHSKTDNFKVEPPDGVIEIDTRFFNDLNGDGHKQDNEPWLDGLNVTWTDTLGASNIKTSYLNPALNVNHEAHVEGPEVGTHIIAIANQAGCTVGLVHLDNVDQAAGPQTVAVTIFPKDKNVTHFIDVACTVTP
jgi:hypothetical protein